MARSRKKAGDNAPRLHPVEKVEVSGKHFTVRVIACIACLVVGVVALVYGVKSYFSASAEWITVETGNAEVNCSGDFTFRYHLGQGEEPPTRERKRLSAFYTEGCVDAYRAFQVMETFEGPANLCYLNAHPNEEVEVMPALYQALEKVVASGERSVYLGPVYGSYWDLSFCQFDQDTYDYDPVRNPELAAFCREIAGFAGDPEQIQVELLGENRVRLAVSEAYLNYCREYGVTELLDFSWMKNAFITDYLADLMMENGFTRGYITSKDGFVRNLDSEASIAFNVPDIRSEGVLVAASVENVPAKSRVFLRNFPLDDGQNPWYYRFESGEIRHSHLNGSTGLPESAANTWIAYSQTLGCGETLLKVLPLYTCDALDRSVAQALTAQGVHSICVRDDRILYTDPALQPENLYEDYTVSPMTAR